MFAPPGDYSGMPPPMGVPPPPVPGAGILPSVGGGAAAAPGLIPPPPATGGPAAVGGNAPTSLPPNNTIYINNLNEKIKQNELRKALRAIFKQFGEILDIIVMSDNYMRGQAFVVFQSVSEAEDAKNKMNGFPLCGKEMRINFAKSKSDAIAKLDGTFAPRAPKRKADKAARVKSSKPRSTPAPSTTTSSSSYIPSSSSNPPPSSSSSSSSSFLARNAAPAPILPNKILFVENLPGDLPATSISPLFESQQGFVELRLVPTRVGIAFAEYTNEIFAGIALQRLNGYKFGDDREMKVSFAKQ